MMTFSPTMRGRIGMLCYALLTAGLLGGCGGGKKSTEPSAGQIPEPVPFAQIAQIRLPPPAIAADKAYLGLAGPDGGFALAEVKAEVLLVQLFDMYCTNCQKDAPAVNELYARVQACTLKDRVRFLGIGKRNTPTEVEIYRERYTVQFPLFPDPDMKNTKLLGIEHTPGFLVVDLKNRRVLHEQWRLPSADEMFERLAAAAAAKP
ncbi:MAG: TlpA family protein disulfide reductase [Kiritimatiellae bacterium]|nr:TlpA family protein disulfide reductase [Kiritimatiellia bacterium]